MNLKLALLINFLAGCMAYTPGLVKAPLYRYWNCIGLNIVLLKTNHINST